MKPEPEPTAAAAAVVSEEEPQGPGNSPFADGPDAPISEQKEKGHPVRKAVTLIATGAAAVFALKWRRRQETVFGLAVGLVVGIRIRRKYRRNRAQREQMSELLSTNWDRLMGKKGITSFAYWNRNTTKESLCWLNTLIKLMWPYYNEAISSTVVSVVGQIIEEKKPGFLNEIAFKKFTLGEVPFQLNNMKMVKKRWKQTVENGLEFVAEMRWHGDVNIVLALQGLVQESRSFCKVKIGRLLISGPLRVRLKPFVPIIPCFGSISVSFVCPPDVDFDLQMTGALALTNPITNWLRPLIRNIIMDKLVSPEQVIIPLMGPDKVPRSLIFPGRKGILRVCFRRAEDLRLTDIGGTCDPYITAYTTKRDSYMSKIQLQTTEPVWDEEAVFIITDESQCVFLELKDSDNSLVDRGDDLLGRAKIGPLEDIPGLFKAEMVERTLELGLGDWFTKQADGSRCPGTGAGRIFLELQYRTMEELRKVPEDKIPTPGEPQVQSGILFCHLKRALNVGEGGVKATLALEGHENYESEFSEAKLEEEPQKQQQQAEQEQEEQEEDTVSGGEGESIVWRSSAAWQTQFGFVNIKADKTLRVELFKKKGLGAKPIGWVELPVALPATPGGPKMLNSVYSLQGLPEFGKDPTYQGAAVELGLEWIPVDTNAPPDMEDMFKSMGVLKIRLCNARGLPQTDLVGDTDPYVVFQIGANRRFKSTTKDNNRSPEWMEEFTFIRVEQDETVLVSMFDEGPVRDEHIGNVAIPVAAVRACEGGRLSGAWLLQGAKKGSICMDLVWLPYSSDFRPFLDSGLPSVAAATDVEPPIWPAEAAENEIVPPFAFDMRKVDVEVELRRAVVPPAPVKEGSGKASVPVHLKTNMAIQGVNQISKDFLGDGNPLETEPFRWTAVPQFATLDITVWKSGKSQGEELGSFSIELRDALLSEDGSREMSFHLPAGNGLLELVITVTPVEAKQLCGSCLNVVLEKGTGLRAADASGKSDPHCYLRVRDQVFKSTTKHSTLEPRWMEHFQFVDVEPHEVLELEVMDADKTAGKDDLGHVLLPLRGVFEAHEQKLQRILPLQGPKAQGELYLKLVWVSNPMATLSSMETPLSSHKICIDDSANASLQQQPRAAPAISKKGGLKVTLHGASDLVQPEGLFSTVDSYVKFTMSGHLGSEKGAEEFRSSVAKGSLNPKWEAEEFVFKVAEADDMLNVRLTEKKMLGKNVLGHLIIPIRELQDSPGGSLRKAWPCGGEKGGLAATIDLTLELTSMV